VKNYMVPFYVSKTLLFYNKTMLKEAGIARPPQTFDELLDAARKMTKGEKSGFMTLNFDWLDWPLLAMNGVDLLTPDLRKAAFNTPAAVKTVEALAQATADGTINKVAWTGRWVEPNNAFAAGTVGLYQAHAPAFFYVRGGGPWVNGDTLGATQMPGGLAVPNSHGLGISKSSKYPELAWEFIKLATNEKWAYAFGKHFKLFTGTKVDGRLMELQKEDPLAASIMKTQAEHVDKLGHLAAGKRADQGRVLLGVPGRRARAQAGRGRAGRGRAEGEPAARPLRGPRSRHGGREARASSGRSSRPRSRSSCSTAFCRCCGTWPCRCSRGRPSPSLLPG
jgi:spermidine/putrescine-binding protein